MKRKEIDQEKAEKILGVSLPSYFQDGRFTLEGVMGLILTMLGKIPQDQIYNFTSYFDLESSALEKVESLPINFSVYNDAEWWDIDVKKNDLYASKSGQKESWKIEHHFHVSKANSNLHECTVRMLYFEEPR